MPGRSVTADQADHQMNAVSALPMLRGVHGALLHRVRLAQLEQLRVAAEQCFVVTGDRGNRRGAFGGERDRVGFRIVGVGADQSAAAEHAVAAC